MCGRYTITISADRAREDLKIVDMPQDYQPRHNVAPTQPVVVVTSAEERKAVWMKWGLIPFWARDPTIGSRLINARSETVSEKPAFKYAFTKRRCLVLADGFFEWKKGAGPKRRSQPYYFRRGDGKPFAFAGLWEFWRSPEGSDVRTCTIITCEANGLVKSVHERMPVMLSGEKMWSWLSEDQPKDLLGLLRPYPADEMVAYPVSTQVNGAEIDTPELILPLVV